VRRVLRKSGKAVLSGPQPRTATFTTQTPQVDAGAMQNAGDLLVLTADGLFEGANAKAEQFGAKRVVEAVRASRDRPPAEIINNLYKAVVEFSDGTKQADDLTAVVIKRTPG